MHLFGLETKNELAVVKGVPICEIYKIFLKDFVEKFQHLTGTQK